MNADTDACCMTYTPLLLERIGHKFFPQKFPNYPEDKGKDGSSGIIRDCIITKTVADIMKYQAALLATLLLLSDYSTTQRQAFQRDVSKNVSEVDETISASDQGMNDPTISLSTRVLFRDPGLRK